MINTERSMELLWSNAAATLRLFSSKAKSNTKKYLQRQMKDEFAAKAREHSYRARSAFKLIEMDDRFEILKPGMTVVDVGCAPGSWSQVVVERCELNIKNASGYLIGADLQHVAPIPGAEVLSTSDITSVKVQETIAKKLNGRPVNVVLSDMAPNPTGDSATDHLRLVNLCRTVFHLFASPHEAFKAEELTSRRTPLFELTADGMFICKLWDGIYREPFMLELLKFFNQANNSMPWRHAVKVAIAAGEAVAKALTRAIKEELQQSQHAAARHGTRTGQSASETRENANANARLGISLEESLQILDVKPPIDPAEVEKKYEHLFNINDKTKGGSFYLQSKIYRAKERIDEELRRQAGQSGVKEDSRQVENEK